MTKAKHMRGDSSSSQAGVLHSGEEPTSRPPWWSVPRVVGGVIVALFLSIVIGGSWVGLRHIERRTRERVGDSLHTVVEATHESLRAWFDAESEYAEKFARDPTLVKLTEHQLGIPRTRDALLTSDGTTDLRTYFRERGLGHEELDFSLIAPDFTNIFSRRDENVGLRNVIAEQRPDRLQLAFSGKTVFMPPLRSDLSRPNVAVPRRFW